MIDTNIGCQLLAIAIRPMLNNLVTAIKGCGVHFCLYEQENGKMEWPSLLGPDKMKLLKNLPNHFNDCQLIEMVNDVERLWKVTHHNYN